jgi:hypothetical protein
LPLPVVACQGAETLFPVAIANVTHLSLTVAAIVLDKSMMKLRNRKIRI